MKATECTEEEDWELRIENWELRKENGELKKLKNREWENESHRAHGERGLRMENGEWGYKWRFLTTKITKEE